VIAETLGIMPWDLARLTVGEFRSAVAYIDRRLEGGEDD
jgi:hypothetical protein